MIHSPNRLLSQLALLLFLLASAAVAQDAAPPPPSPARLENPDFEQGEVGQQPPGWRFSSSVAATFVVVDQDPFAGERAAFVDASNEVETERIFTTLVQSIDAATWRGKRVRYRAAVKVEGMAEGTGAQLWCRVDRPKDADGNRQRGGFDNMGDRPIASGDWAHYDIVLDVAEDAEQIVLGMFLLAYGKAWIDDVSLAVAEESVGVTKEATDVSGRQQIIRRARAAAGDAPAQPFWTPWLILPLLACILFVFGVLPMHRRADGKPDVGASLLRRFGFHFTWIYWLLYFWPRFAAAVAAFVDWSLLQLRYEPDLSLAQWVREHGSDFGAAVAHLANDWIIGFEGEMVPPNGSGDTTQSYLMLFGFFLIAWLAAMVLAFALRRMKVQTRAVGADLVWSFLRYALAAVLLSYGLGKMGITHNQFRELGEYDLNRTWGDSSPMGVVWSFMGASRPYTMFGGGSEVLCALLLIWRRTATLGGLASIAVMTNVAMLNYCYDVPVKQFSTHLLIASAVVVVFDLPRLLDVFAKNRPTERFAPPTVWRPGWPWWLGLIGKLVVIAALIVLPVWGYSQQLAADLEKEPPAAGARDGQKQHLLTSRGFRWINEVPFGR